MELAVYKAIKPKDTNNDKVFMVMGPWYHGEEIGDASSLGALKFGSDTGLYFRKNILLPFLNQYLKDGAPKANVATVTAFETGTNTWRSLPAWPAGCESGCAVHAKPLYLEAGFKAGFDAPRSGGTEFEEYISDPAKPVPFRSRPDSAGWIWRRFYLVGVAGGRSARSLRTPGCIGVLIRRVDGAGKDQRTAGRASDCIDQRNAIRIGW